MLTAVLLNFLLLIHDVGRKVKKKFY